MHNTSNTSDGGSIPAARGSASVAVKAPNDKEWILLCHNHIFWAFWTQNFCTSSQILWLQWLAAGLQFSKENPTGKEKVVLLKVMVIYILCISSHLALAFELKKPQGWVELSAYLTLICPIHGPLPTRYSWTEFSKADTWVGLCRNPLPAAWPQAFLLTCTCGKGRKKHKMWAKEEK